MGEPVRDSMRDSYPDATLLGSTARRRFGSGNGPLGNDLTGQLIYQERCP